MISVINKIKIILIVILIISSVLVILNYHIQTETIPPLKDKIEYNNEVLESTNSQFKKYQTDVNSIKKRVHDKNDELKLLQSSDIYYLHNPTYSEVIDFIEIDKTNEKEYNDNSFICSDFARIVNNNADKYGIRCGYTHITLSGYFDHVCVVFDIIDKGLTFVEPQNDKIVNLRIGKHYWADCMPVQEGYYYPREFGWIIEGYDIYW